MHEKVSDLGSLSWLRGFGDKDSLSAFPEYILGVLGSQAKVLKC